MPSQPEQNVLPRERAVDAAMTQVRRAGESMPDLPRAMIQNVATAFAALTVVLVATTYLLAVVGVLWLVLDYLISHTLLLGAGGSVILYVILALVALVAVVLLAKPIFHLGSAEGDAIQLSEREQPQLYSYVEALCDALNTPKPERIEVFIDANASASMTGPLLGLFSRRPVLSLGLTLWSGMSLQQFTGIVCHELAHFSQGRAMRFRLIIHAVNSWFARAVYARDRVDLWLARASALPVIGSALIPVNLLLTAGRGILWVFMMIAHAASGLVSRRGEYEADKLMAAMIGGDELVVTLQRIAVLSMCLDATRDDLRNAYLGGRLADDVPALAAARSQGMSEERREQLIRLVKLETAQWHSTHPTLAQRARAAKALGATPLVDLLGPASVLVRDFEQLCKKQTNQAYQAMLGDEFKRLKLIPTAKLVEEIDAAESANQALARFYQCRPLLTRPLLARDQALLPPSDVDAVATRLAESRELMLGKIKAYDKMVNRLIRIEDRLVDLRIALALAEAGFELNPQQLRLSRASAAAIRMEISKREDAKAPILEELDNFERVVIERLTTATALLNCDEIQAEMEPEQAARLGKLSQKVLRASRAIERSMPSMTALSTDCNALLTMLQAGGQAPNQRKFKRSAEQLGAQICDQMRTLKAELGDPAYPFEHADLTTSISGYVVPSLPEDPKDFERVLLLGGETLERMESMVFRCMAVAAETAEQVEVAAGFAQQAAPNMDKEFEAFLLEAERGQRRSDAALSENWLVPLATAALIFIGVFLAGLGATSITPTVTSSVVPHHSQYKPTIVPSVVVDPSRGPTFFDPVRDWRIDNMPKPSYPPGYQPPTGPNYNNPNPYQRQNQPGYNTPGYNNPHQRPGYNPSNRPGYNNPNDPHRRSPSQPNRPSSPQPYRPSSPGGPQP